MGDPVPILRQPGLRTLLGPGAAALLLCLAPAASALDPYEAGGARFDLTALDRTGNACSDFYQFACGGWLAKNPLPSDESRFGRFNELHQRNLETLRGILERAAVPSRGRSEGDREIGDYYAACMDEAGSEAKGLRPLERELARIDALHDQAGLSEEVARLHAIGVPALFAFASEQDFKDSRSVIAKADQGGLGLPARDYYLRDDPKTKEMRERYAAHVQRTFELTGQAREAAAESARAVMELETALARGSLDLESRRDPSRLYHKMTRAELQALVPSFDWRRYFAAAKAPRFDSLNVAAPEFFKALQGVLVEGGALGRLKAYLRWQLVRDAAPLLPEAFAKESFAFYEQTLTGAREMRPRWKRCVELADEHLGDALGRRYVEETFGAEGKARMQSMVAALEKALGRNIQKLPWMTAATRGQALAKLAAIANKIGYPDTWRDYGGLKVRRSDALGNALRARAFEVRRRLAKIGRPVDRQEWEMSPPTVNAYYNHLMNDINFPAGILQPPFFDKARDDAVNFGAIGAVIGHELTHGFDDFGRQFGADGNFDDWWTAEDAQEFEKRSACLVDQYGAYDAAPDVKLSGKLTLGENVADNGGLRIAYMALKYVLGKQRPRRIEGFTAEQRFFLGWGQIWCETQAEEDARRRARTDVHSPGRYRVNGVVSNMPEFGNAFGCKAGALMVRRRPCRVW